MTGINSKWNYDGVIVLPQFDDESLAEFQRFINDLGDTAYIQGFENGCENQELGCNGCTFEGVEEWEMPCAKCKRGCKDYWRRKS